MIIVLWLFPTILFLSTLSLRRATPYAKMRKRHSTISIHALLAESDRWSLNQSRTSGLFLSTLSLRRATYGPILTITYLTLFLSTLSLRRATQRPSWGECQKCISIHALLAESDGGSGVGRRRRVIFLSTLSLRRATRVLDDSKSSIEDFYPRSPCGERQIFH